MHVLTLIITHCNILTICAGCRDSFRQLNAAAGCCDHCLPGRCLEDSSHCSLQKLPEYVWGLRPRSALQLHQGNNVGIAGSLEQSPPPSVRSFYPSGIHSRKPICLSLLLPELGVIGRTKERCPFLSLPLICLACHISSWQPASTEAQAQSDC